MHRAQSCCLLIDWGGGRDEVGKEEERREMSKEDWGMEEKKGEDEPMRFAPKKGEKKKKKITLRSDREE